MLERLVLWHRVLPGQSVGVDWFRRVESTLTEAGGNIAAQLGGTTVATFSNLDLTTALDAALQLLDEAERVDPPVHLAFGVASGPTQTDGEPSADLQTQGDGFDAAQAAANHAGAGDLCLHRSSMQKAEKTYLFRSQSGKGTDFALIDREFPKREVCREAIGKLGPVRFPTEGSEDLAKLKGTAASSGMQWFVLRGRVGAGAEQWVDALANELAPPLLLRFEPVPGSLEPLGSLRHGLLREWESPEGVEAALGGVPAAKVLAGIAAGRTTKRADAIRAVQTLLASFSDEGKRPWLFLNPFSSLDPASREVIALATFRATTECFVIARVPEGTSIPKVLARMVSHDTPVPHIAESDTAAVAQSVLGDATAASIAQRVAELGGNTPLGILSAARTLVTSGDLIHRSGAFEWRLRARAGRATPVTSLIEERLTLLDETARRILLTVCVLPQGSSNDLLWEVMKLDGLDGEECFDAIETLRKQALLTPDNPLRVTSGLLRTVVIETTPAARIREIHGHVATAMRGLLDAQADFANATLGYYLHESGDNLAGAKCLLRAGAAASTAGFARASLRLAAAAVEYDPSAETKAEASKINMVAASQPPPPPPSVPPPVNAPAFKDNELSGARTFPPGTQVSMETIEAILHGDFDTADHTIDVAIAEGCNPIAADRMRAMAYLVRGDLPGAMRLVEKTRRGSKSDPASQARYKIARAMVLLRSGRPSQALRDGLSALSSTRRHEDRAGERAAMHALAQAFRQLGREDDALSILDSAAANG